MQVHDTDQNSEKWIRCKMRNSILLTGLMSPPRPQKKKEADLKNGESSGGHSHSMGREADSQTCISVEYGLYF